MESVKTRHSASARSGAGSAGSSQSARPEEAGALKQHYEILKELAECYAALADSWRIGIKKKEKTELVTSGPYGRIRHPIYSFQILALLGAAMLIPTVVSLALLVLHTACSTIKALDEEAYLTGVHGESYKHFLARTGRFLPKLLRPAAPSE